ncbi:MAG: hypothetical protein WCT77_09585, partial [Bacteroidota bacterium]
QYWKNKYLRRNNGIKFLKLHGSLDWHWFDFYKHKVIYKQKIGKINKKLDDFPKVFDDGICQISAKGTPLFLTGINDKYLDYNYGIFLDMMDNFYRLLNKTKYLIIIGYGFGDNAINLRIIDWFDKNKYRKIIVVSPNMETVIQNARGGISRRLKELENDKNRLIIIKKRFEDTNSQEIIQNLR